LKTVLPFLSLLLLAGGAEAAGVAPHRAIYDLTLLRATEGAHMRSAAGKLAFEVDGSRCEGYTVNFRMATKYRQESGESTLIDTLSTTYENAAATELRHQSKESVNGTARGSERITLNRKTAESEGTVELAKGYMPSIQGCVKVASIKSSTTVNVRTAGSESSPTRSCAVAVIS
jgi:hypothetical protein